MLRNAIIISSVLRDYIEIALNLCHLYRMSIENSLKHNGIGKGRGEKHESREREGMSAKTVCMPYYSSHFDR